MLRFQKRYFAITLILFLTEVLIALYAHDKFIRPYGGDILVAVLMYCFVRSFVKLRTKPTAIAVLLLCYCIEFLQYLNVVKRMGLGDVRLARTVIGTSFAWLDMVAYTTGILWVLWFENKCRRAKKE